MEVRVVKGAAPIAKKVIEQVLKKHPQRENLRKLEKDSLMFRPGSIQSHLSLKDKIFSLDIILFFSIIALGIISFAMYSTDGGEFAYHTKSHIIRFFVFFFSFL